MYRFTGEMDGADLKDLEKALPVGSIPSFLALYRLWRNPLNTPFSIR